MDPEETLQFRPEAAVDEVIANYGRAARAGVAPTRETLLERSFYIRLFS